MMSFAGVVLDFPPPDVLSRVRRHLDYRWLRLWDEPWAWRPPRSLPVRAWDPWPVKNPQALSSRPWLREGPLRLNTLLWPSGASRWSVFHAVVDDATMDRIRGATGSFGQPLVIDDGTGPVLSVTMYPLPPRPLSQIAGANGFSLLTLLDRRAYWPWLSADVEVVGGTTTWADLFTAIAAALGITLDVDDVPAAYLSPPAALSSAYDSLPALLDAACLSCGLRFAAALDGTSYRCWSVAAAQTQVARNLAGVSNPRVAGGLFLQGTDLNGILPDAVRVVFPRADDGLPDPAPVAVPVTLASLNFPPGAPVGGIGGLTKTFHSSAVATYSGGSLSNSAALTALATQAATDFYGWQAAGNYDVAYAGVAPWLPTGADGLVEYAHAPDFGSGGGILSRFRRDTCLDQQEALWHHTVTPCAAIPTRVRVTGTTLTDTCLYAAELVVRSGCADVAVSPPAAVWLRVDGVSPGAPPPAPAAGDRHLAAPEGVRAADGLPVYVTSERPPAATGAGGGAGVVGPGQTLEVQSGGTLLLDSGAVFVLAGPTWNLTASTTLTVSSSVSLTFVGLSSTTSVVNITTLSWRYDSTSILVLAGPAVQVTQNTTLTVSATTSLTFVGVSSTTSLVNVNSLTWNYNSTSVLVFAGPTWQVTQNTTLTVSSATTLVLTGGSVSTSIVDVTNLTWKFESTAVLVFAGPTVNLTANQAWAITAGDTWTVTGGTLAVNSTFVFGGPSFVFNLTTNYVDLCGDLVFQVCGTPLVPAPVVKFPVPVVPQGGVKIPGPTPVPVVIDPGGSLDLSTGPGPGSPGVIDLTGLLLQMGTGLSWGIVDDLVTTISSGKAWTVTGGKVDFTGSKVTGAGGLLTSQATTYTGTTADAYGVVFDLVNGQGIHGSYVISNTGASNSAQFRVTYTDALGHVTVGAPFPVGVGQFSCFVVDEVAILNTPVVRLKLEVQSLNAGQSAAYSVILSVTGPAALAVGNGGTGADLSATGGQGQIATQPTAGGPLAVVGPDLADLQLVGAVFGR
jgi:hypothetical protein